ncbi:hypothetical protein [His 1 virus]|uniref:Putative transmembrane protein ORF28 n=1 Tax=His1 virus (isolate Australia/Victoria) TaxID=654912 RepID=Y028_HIS1I|nr:hypothetical protein His1V_gp28 [His 1 virus]Q25BG7.1 RecName: Full=Putative transmembrane protein ORF28 [His1 virus (isolate Victoria)]AAQ13747.1 hypothetical protein [His 1 virus]
MKAKQEIKKIKEFDYDAWIESKELKDIFPPRIMLLWWIGILGMLNYNLVQIVPNSGVALLSVSTFIVGCGLCIGFMLGIEQKKNR